jgi:hypothetical protein
VNTVPGSLRVLKRWEADVRILGAVSIIAIGVAVAGSPHVALAKRDKSTDSILKHTATGKHYNNVTIHDTGGGHGKPHDNTNQGGGHGKPHDDTNPGGGTGKPKNPPPPDTSHAPKFTPGATGVKNISR